MNDVREEALTMDVNQEINRLVRQAIMEEINNLAIRAAIREKIEAAGVSHDDIKQMVADTIDSYIRSAMGGNVEEQVQKRFDKILSGLIRDNFNYVIRSVVGYGGNDAVRRHIEKLVSEELQRSFDVSFSITPKTDKGREDGTTDV